MHRVIFHWRSSSSAAAFLGIVCLVFATAWKTQEGPSVPGAFAFSRYAVAADTEVASAAGAQILARGGNAADAAAATMLALGVASPASSGIGGGGFLLYYRARDRSLTFLDFRETAPAAATPDMFAAREGDSTQIAAARSQVGGLAVAVPGEAAGIEEMVRRFGSRRVNLAAIAQPAITLAEQGFPVTSYVREAAGYVESSMRGDPLLSSWLGEGAASMPETLRNPELARTLRTFASQGARGFYRGAIARAIVDAVTRSGGILTSTDLANYRVVERQPLQTERFGYRWVTAPAPSAGGFTLLHSLALMEAWAPEGGWREGPEYRHALSQSWAGAYGDRAGYFGDPSFVDVPVDALLAPERLARRASLFDPNRVRSMADWDMPHDDTAAREGGTSHLCVRDAEGNIAAVTTTVNLLFGARISAQGIVLNDEMDDFARQVGQANAFGLPGGAPNLPGPGRRPVSSMSPTIVFQGDEPVFCVGASGGSRIPTASEQVALGTLVLGRTLSEAMTDPRIHHQGEPNALAFEKGLPMSFLRALFTIGHELRAVSQVANVSAIHISRAGEALRLWASGDPRKDGLPAGE